MALAVWDITEPEEQWEEVASASVQLRLLPREAPAGPAAGRCREHAGVALEGVEEWGRPRSVLPEAWSAEPQRLRRQCVTRARTSVQARRLRALAILFVLALVVLLALPVRAWAGQTSGPAPGGLAGSTPGHPAVYVVRPGDTLWSIAARLTPGGDPRPIVSQLASETGSTTVVPGEHIVLPG